MEPEEQAFYTAVEDHFAALFRTSSMILPKDFALLRAWYQQGAPLAAILAGLDEVFEACRLRGEEPVFPLSYCRRAINGHVRRLAAARLGSLTPVEAGVDPAAALAGLTAAVWDAAAHWEGSPLEKILTRLAEAVATVPSEAPAAAVEEALSRLEIGALEALAGALPAAERERLDAEAEAAAQGVDASSEVGRRTRRAVLLRSVRELVGLPRLELGGDAA